MAQQEVATTKVTFRTDAHPTYRYRVVKPIPDATPHKEKLPGQGGEFSFWHWGDNVIGMLLESGRVYNIPDIKELEDDGIIEKVPKPRQ